MLPADVSCIALTPHEDSRGVFTEVFRDSWAVGVAPAQWNLVSSAANVLRGVHAHWRHSDYLLVASGRMTLGLHDLRQGSDTEGLAVALELRGEKPSGVVIPPGVAHGFYFTEPSIHVYAVSHEWDPSDELGCRWDDPELGIPWPADDPLLSERDALLGTLTDLRDAIHAAQIAA